MSIFYILEKEGIRENETPVLDLFVTEEFVVAVLELPGVSKENIKLSFSNEYLIVEAYKKNNPIYREAINFYVLEINYDRYYRKVSLPVRIEPEEVDINYDNGIVIIKMPREKIIYREVPIG